MEQTPSTFELQLPTTLLRVCCDVAADQTGTTRLLSAATARSEDVDITVTSIKKQWIKLFFQGAVGGIIDVVNDQWTCSIESVNISPPLNLNTHAAHSLSAVMCQPKTLDHAEDGKGENGINTSKKAAITEVLRHQALKPCQTDVLQASERKKSKQSLRKSQRVQERQQRLSTCCHSPSTPADIVLRNTCSETGRSAGVENTNVALNKTGHQTSRLVNIDKQTEHFSKHSRKKKKKHKTTGVGKELVMKDEGESDQSDTCINDHVARDITPLGGAGDSELQMECVTDNKEDEQTETTGTMRKRRRTITDPNVQPYLCPQCGHPFIVAVSLMRHIAATHRDLPNYNTIVNAAEEMRDSRLKAASAISVTCPVCERTMRGTRVFMHMRKWHMDDSDYDSRVALVKKQYNVERERVYQLNSWGRERVPCPHCGLAGSRRRLSHHIKYQCKKNAQRHRFLRCRHCGYGTHLADRLAEHMKLHQAGRNFMCDHCGKRYVSQAGLTVHLRQKHQEAKRNPILSHPCPQCRKTFIHESRLKKHMTIHAEDRCFVCDTCGKSFKERGTMLAHRRTQHLGQYRYHCSKCGHGVEKRSYLLSHRCHTSASNTAEMVVEQPVFRGQSVVVVAMQSDINKTGRELAMNVGEMQLNRDLLAMNGSDRLLQDHTEPSII